MADVVTKSLHSFDVRECQGGSFVVAFRDERGMLKDQQRAFTDASDLLAWMQRELRPAQKFEVKATGSYKFRRKHSVLPYANISNGDADGVLANGKASDEFRIYGTYVDGEVAGQLEEDTERVRQERLKRRLQAARVNRAGQTPKVIALPGVTTPTRAKKLWSMFGWVDWR